MRQLCSGLRGWNEHLVGGVVTNLGEASVHLLKSQRVHFQNCQLSEKSIRQKTKGWTFPIHIEVNDRLETLKHFVRAQKAEHRQAGNMDLTWQGVTRGAGKHIGKSPIY